ncbi:MAG: chloride channel protein, partial [Oscillospiraceae bacterium]|nr:chloride channel protein [Oscillospiraceae bacterium]
MPTISGRMYCTLAALCSPSAPAMSRSKQAMQKPILAGLPSFCSSSAAMGYGKWLKNKYLRIIVASGIIIGLNLMLKTTDYMGPGSELIINAVESGQARPFDFFWKLLLTALTMKAGFKGGEIVPSFCIGATLGCVLGQMLGLAPGLCAACGMVA